jgi:hypothetical protein
MVRPEAAALPRLTAESALARWKYTQGELPAVEKEERQESRQQQKRAIRIARRLSFPTRMFIASPFIGP